MRPSGHTHSGLEVQLCRCSLLIDTICHADMRTEEAQSCDRWTTVEVRRLCMRMP